MVRSLSLCTLKQFSLYQLHIIIPVSSIERWMCVWFIAEPQPCQWTKPNFLCSFYTPRTRKNAQESLLFEKCEDKLADWRYAVCFRQRAGLCGLQLSAQPGQFIFNSGLAVQEEAVGPDCHNFTINSNNDYIQVGDSLLANKQHNTHNRTYDATLCYCNWNTSLL